MQDASWGWGPASNGKTLFAGSAGAGGWFGCQRTHLPGDGALFGVSVASVVKWSQRSVLSGSGSGKSQKEIRRGTERLKARKNQLNIRIFTAWASPVREGFEPGGKQPIALRSEHILG